MGLPVFLASPGRPPARMGCNAHLDLAGGRLGGDRVLVSACLAGIACRYDGRARPHDLVTGAVRRGVAFPVCPEQLGGLSTPRPAAEIAHGDGHDVLAGTAQVMTVDGDDVTAGFVRGAHAVLREATRRNVDRAWLQAFSPSCGHGSIYDGTHTSRLVTGSGVTAALLASSGIVVEALHGSKNSP